MKKAVWAALAAAIIFSGCTALQSKEFNAAVFGGYSLGAFLGYFFWALVGAYMLMQWNANNRDVISTRTPTQWSWKFWVRDNMRRIVFNLVLIIVVLRFWGDMTGFFSRTLGVTLGEKLNEFWAFMVGFSSDLLAVLMNRVKGIKLSGTTEVKNRPPDFRKEVQDQLNEKQNQQ